MNFNCRIGKRYKLILEEEQCLCDGCYFDGDMFERRCPRDPDSLQLECIKDGDQIWVKYELP